MQNDTTSAINAQKASSPLTGLSLNRDNEGTNPAVRNRNGAGGMAEDQMFDDLEVMLGGGATQVPKPNNPSKVKPISKRGSNSQIVPMNDLDDLEDMYQFDAKRKKAASKKAPVPTTQ